MTPPHVCPTPAAAKVHRVTGNPRYCELTDPLHPAYSPPHVATVAAMAAGWPDDQAPTWRPAWSPPVPCDDEIAEAKRRATLCPHRTPTSTCQCSGFCAKGRGDRVDYETGPRTVANLDTCLACPDLPA